MPTPNVSPLLTLCVASPGGTPVRSVASAQSNGDFQAALQRASVGHVNALRKQHELQQASRQHRDDQRAARDRADENLAKPTVASREPTTPPMSAARHPVATQQADPDPVSETTRQDVMSAVTPDAAPSDGTASAAQERNESEVESSLDSLLGTADPAGSQIPLVTPTDASIQVPIAPSNLKAAPVDAALGVTLMMPSHPEQGVDTLTTKALDLSAIDPVKPLLMDSPALNVDPVAGVDLPLPRGIGQPPAVDGAANAQPGTADVLMNAPANDLAAVLPGAKAVSGNTEKVTDQPKALMSDGALNTTDEADFVMCKMEVGPDLSSPTSRAVGGGGHEPRLNLADVVSGTVEGGSLVTTAGSSAASKTDDPGPASISPGVDGAKGAANPVLTQFLSPAGNQPSEKITLPMGVAFGHAQWTQNLAERTGWLVDHKIEKADIQLDPPELGPIAVRIHMQNDQVSIIFTAQNANVKEAMDQSMARLKELLQAQGITLSHSDVSSQQQNRRDPAQGEKGPANRYIEEEELPLATVKVNVPSRYKIDYFA